MNHLNDLLDVFDRRHRQDSMPQIKDVAGARTGALKDVAYVSFDDWEGSAEGQRIKVALDGSFGTDRIPGEIERYAPVHSDDVAAGVGQCIEHARCIRSEHDDRNFLSTQLSNDALR